MSGDRVFRQEGLTAAPAGADDDVVGPAKKAYDDRRISASQTPSRRDRARGAFAAWNGPGAVEIGRASNSRESVLATRAARGQPAPGTSGYDPSVYAAGDEAPDVEGARKAMNQKKVDAWKTPSRRDRERAR